ncbi:MAG: ABC transporter permease [Bacillota bacterium]
MLHALRVYWLLTVALGKGQLQYRASFFSQMVAMAISYGSQFVALRWLTDRFPRVAGWDLQELILLYGLTVLAWGIAESLFIHFERFEQEVSQGAFDRALARPVHPFVTALAGSSPITGVGQLLFAVAAIAWAIWASGMTITAGKLLYLVLAGISGGLIFGASLVAVGAMAFYTRRTESLFWTIIVPGRQLVYYPINLYHRSLQILLMAVMPFAFVNYFPAHALLDKADQLRIPMLAWLSPLVAVGFFYLAYRFWNHGLNRYVGAGS